MRRLPDERDERIEAPLLGSRSKGGVGKSMMTAATNQGIDEHELVHDVRVRA
jgi:hypothetical protein